MENPFCAAVGAVWGKGKKSSGLFGGSGRCTIEFQVTLLYIQVSDFFFRFIWSSNLGKLVKGKSSVKSLQVGESTWLGFPNGFKKLDQSQ